MKLIILSLLLRNNILPNGAGNQRAENFLAYKDFNGTHPGFFPSGSPAMLEIFP
jgi:hypothetical protein